LRILNQSCQREKLEIWCYWLKLGEWVRWHQFEHQFLDLGEGEGDADVGASLPPYFNLAVNLAHQGVNDNQTH